MEGIQNIKANNMVQERKEIFKQDQWDVKAFYKSIEQWKEEYQKVLRNQTKQNKWPEIRSFQGTLADSSKQVKDLFDLFFQILRTIESLYVYAHLRHDEDLTNETYKHAYDQMTLLLHDFQKETSWIQPELLSLSDQKIQEYLQDKTLEEYRVHLEKIVRLKPHTRSMESEELIAQVGQSMMTSSKAFSVFNNADLEFEKVVDGKGKEHLLTQGSYQLYLQSEDRVLRKHAFQSLYNSYGKFENTICELLSGQIQNDVFMKEVRRYSSCLEAALYPHEIDRKVYENLIQTTRKALSEIYPYFDFRKEALGYEELHLYDLHVSMIPAYEKKYSFEEAVHLVIESVEPLGKEYQTTLERGLLEERWVDRYENKGKRSGAYSSGCYDSHPYILMNFQGTLRDVMTLAHEAGHSMHSYYSKKHQPYHYADYSIFVAEVASTFNEELLFQLLLQKATTPEETCFLLNRKIDDIRSTLFRQTMFAEFELKMHELAEQGIPLQVGNLKEIYLQLNRDYFGDAVVIDPEIAIEFLRIPHFYHSFYVYQYATGISAALSLAKNVIEKGEKARDAYLQFLSSGCSKPPLEVLLIAGVDMYSEKPILDAIEHFKSLTSLLKRDFDALKKPCEKNNLNVHRK